MDVQILRAIVQSRVDLTKEVDDPEEFARSLKEDRFPIVCPTILAALTRSFTDLISCKVSPEAYQRYAVRIEAIQILRDWLRPRRQLESFGVFTSGERVLELASGILRVRLKNDIFLRDDGNTDVLVNLAKALMCLVPRNKSLLPDLEKLLVGIAGLKQTEESRRLILSAAKEKDNLELGSRTIEQLYICQSAKLIEEPLVENFVESLRESPENNAAPEELRNCRGIDALLKVAAESPSVFQIASSVLKEILVHSDYSPRVIDYIAKIRNSLGSRCRRRNKNVLDLYPLRSQSCALLLNIKPEQHTRNSRDYVLRELKKINESNPDETLILLSHFPSWLDELAARLDDSGAIASMSVDDELKSCNEHNSVERHSS